MAGDAVSARAQRLSAYRPRQVDLPEFRGRRRSSAAAAICASTTPTRPRKSRNTSTRSRRDVRWLGFDWGKHLYHASDYFEQLYEWAEHLIEHGLRLCRRPVAGRDAREPRHADRARPRQPVSRPRRRGEPRPVPPHAGRRVPQRRARAARQDRHGLGQHEPARSGALPHPPRDPPAHRRRMVHLPDL